MIRKALFAWLALVSLAHAQEFRITLHSGERELVGVPVRVPLQVPPASADVADWQIFTTSSTPPVPALLTMPNFVTASLPAENRSVRRDLLFVLPKIHGKIDIVARPTIPNPDGVTGNPVLFSKKLRWVEKAGAHIDLLAGDQPVMRYMNRPYDADKATRDLSFKVFHHLWDFEGKRFVTNGGHNNEDAATSKLLYPHHRGLMFAFNRISYGDKQTADTWHCNKGEHTSHVKTLHQLAGVDIAEHRVLLNWHGQKDDVFAQEERQYTVYKLADGVLIEFASRLKSKAGNVRLDGDPQHAGFQFRAHNDVAAKTAKQTYYLRPDGKGALDETRNWDPKTKKGPVDLPWNVLSFVLDDQRYSVEYIDHPNNPGEKRYSERNYGRFGCYFEYDLTEEKPLVLNHRIWFQKGEMTKEQAARLQDVFVTPVKVVSVK